MPDDLGANTRDIAMNSAAMRVTLSMLCVLAAVMLIVAPVTAETQTDAEAPTETEEQERQTIYDADIEGRLGLDEEQKPLVEEIIKRSNKEQRRILRKYGIDPMDQPRAILLIQAAGELMDLGRRTRRKLRPILNGDQLREYDRIIQEVEARVREAVRW